MDKACFQRYLLEALDNPDVKKAIVDIAKEGMEPKPKRFSLFHSDSECENQGQTCKALEKKCQELERKNRDVEERLTASQQRVSQLQAENEGMRQQIRTLAQAEEVRRNLEVACGQLKEDKASLQAKVEELSREGQENLQVRNQLELKTKELQGQLTRWQDTYAGVEQAYQRFGQVSDSVRKALTRVINSESPIAFLIYCSQIDNLEALWDHAKSGLDTLSAGDLSILTETMAFCVEQINALYEEPLYRLLSDEVGCPFDGLRHIRGRHCSAYQGDIQQVLLPGIWNERTQEFLRKCVVTY